MRKSLVQPTLAMLTSMNVFVAGTWVAPASARTANRAAGIVRSQLVPVSITDDGAAQQKPLKIMAFGGSSAAGWDDIKGEGYLRRALDNVSSAFHVPINFNNQARSGYTGWKIASAFDPLIHQFKPDIVIISWGLLNEMSQKIPVADFQAQVKEEVQIALHEGADVWIVTPPPTPATYVGHDVPLEPKYAYAEILGARALHSPHVHVFDLLNAMKKYLRQHHIDWKPLADNNWHLNQDGHTIAGGVLAAAIIRRAPSLNLSR